MKWRDDPFVIVTRFHAQLGPNTKNVYISSTRLSNLYNSPYNILYTACHGFFSHHTRQFHITTCRWYTNLHKIISELKLIMHSTSCTVQLA